MVRLDAGNVLLKPSQRRQLMSHLRRCLRLGQRLGKFILEITIHRVGRQYQLQAVVTDSAGKFQCRTRANDFRGAARDFGRTLANRLHDQWLTLSRVPAIA
jgi:hypothetical protein